MKTKVLAAVLSVTLGFAGTVATLASAYSIKGTVNGTKVTASLKYIERSGEFKARLETGNPVDRLSITLGRYVNGKDYEDLDKKSARNSKLIYINNTEAEATDDVLAIYQAKSGSEKWVKTIECDSLYFSE